MWCERKQNFRTAQTKAVYIAALALCFVCLFLLAAERPGLGSALFQGAALRYEGLGPQESVCLPRATGVDNCIDRGLGRCMGVSLGLFLCAARTVRHVQRSEETSLRAGRICHCVMSLSLGGHAPPV